MAIFGLFKKNKKDEQKNVFKETKITESNTNANEDVTPATKPEIKKDAASVNPAAEKNSSTQKTNSAAKKNEAPKAEKKTSEPPQKKAVEKAEVKATEKKTAPKNEKTNDTKNAEKAITVPESKSNEVAKEETTDPKAYTGKFEINKSKDGKKFFFNLYASNKVGIATSQMYSSAQSALNGVKSVIANAPTAPIEDQSLKKYDVLPYPKWEIYVDNGGKFRFRLNASNGSCVCHSQGYTTKTACKNGIDSIIRSSKNAEIVKTYISKKDDE